jgi:hypothetical protein
MNRDDSNIGKGGKMKKSDYEKLREDFVTTESKSLMDELIEEKKFCYACGDVVTDDNGYKGYAVEDCDGVLVPGYFCELCATDSMEPIKEAKNE